MYNINFEKSISQANFGFYVSTKDGKFLYANQSFIEILGYEDFYQLQQLNIPKDIYLEKSERDNFLKGVEENTSQHIVKTRVKKRDGSIINVLLSGKILDRDIFEGWMIDITANLEIEKQRDLYFRVIEENSDAIFITDKDGLILYKNNKFDQIVGYLPNNSHAKDIIPVSSERKSFIKHILENVLSKGMWVGNIDVINDKNIIIPCAVKIFALFDSKGKVENYISVFRDNSDKKALEEQLKQSQKAEILGTMSGALVHDINNIITGIGYNLELIRLTKDTSPEKVEKYLSNIEKSIQNASLFMQQFLNFTRKNKITKEPVKISDLMENVISLITPLIKKSKRITFKTEFKDNNINVLGNKSSLVQLLLNLLINSIDAINEVQRENGEISLLSEMITLNDKPFVRIIVRDNGIGIKPEFKDKIFEPFFTSKVKSSENQRQGVGLGLSIALKEVKELGGAIDFISNHGIGTDFIISLPIFETNELHKNKTITTYNQEVRDKKSKATVCIIDDDLYFKNSLSELLNFYGFNVISLTSYKDFIDLPDKKGIDIILLDYILEPGITGEDIVKHNRENNINIPIFLLTGCVDSTILELKKYKCIKSIIEKPVTGDEIVTKINKFLYLNF